MSVARETWLAERRNGVGASEVAAVLGVDPLCSPFALWSEKTGHSTRETTPEMEWGNRIEPVLASYYEDTFKRPIIDHGRHAIRRGAHPVLFSTLDYEIADAHDGRGPGVLECKNADDHLTRAWNDATPLKHVVQVQAQLAVTGYRWGVLAVLLGGNDPRVVEIERNPELIALIEEAVSDFWTSYVEPDVPPPIDGAASTTRAIKALYPEDTGITIALSGDAESWDRERAEAIEQIKAGEIRRDEAENALRFAIGEATWATIPGGGRYQLRVEPRSERTCQHCNKVIQAASRPRVLRRLKK